MIYLFAFGAVVSLLFGWAMWSRDRYKQAFHAVMATNQELDTTIDTLAAENKYIKESIVSLYKKPVYALMTDVQIRQIGQIVARSLEKPKWVN